MREKSTEKGAGTASRKPRIQSVARATQVLMAVAKSDRGLKAVEISQSVGLPKQATYHMVHTLVTLGMLTKAADNRYLMGLRIGPLADAFARHLAPPERLAPFVREAAIATGETCYASGWWEGEIVNLNVSMGRNAVQGGGVPHGLYENAHARASGKLLLAMANERTCDLYLDSHGMVACTKNTITDRDRFKEELAIIRKQGYSIDDEEYRDGLTCLAVPIYDGDVNYVIGLSAPTSIFKRQKDWYISQLREVVSSHASSLLEVA